MSDDAAGRGASERVVPVDVEVLRSDNALRRLVATLAAEPHRPVNLDFEAVDLGAAARLRPFHLLVLANVLANDTTDRDISITLPRNDNVRLAVMRSGVVFGLTVRRAAARPILRGLPSEVAERWIELWRRPWSPHEPALGRLFDDAPREVDSREFAGPGGIIENANNAKRATRVVVAPHLRSREVLYRHCAGIIAGTWLTSVIPRTLDRDRARRRSTWNKLMTERVLREPLLNIVDHAFTGPTGEPPRATRASLVLLARTDGGRNSYPRLHLVVADTGYGLVRTLRPKLRSSGDENDRSVAERSALDILAHAVERQARTARDPGLPWARTSFCQAVQEAVAGGRDAAPLNTEFTVITGDPDAGEQALAVTVRPDGRAERTRLADVPFHGTTVFVSVPIPHATVGALDDRSLVEAPTSVV